MILNDLSEAAQVILFKTINARMRGASKRLSWIDSIRYLVKKQDQKAQCYTINAKSWHRFSLRSYHNQTNWSRKQDFMPGCSIFRYAIFKKPAGTAPESALLAPVLLQRRAPNMGFVTIPALKAPDQPDHCG